MNEPQHPMDGPFFPLEAQDPGGRGEIGLVAESFARNGFAVFPCRDRPEKYPERDKAGRPVLDEDGKEKMVERGAKSPRTRHGFHDATTNLSQIRYWWGRKWPTAMLGVPTGGVNGFWVLDVDVPKGPGEDDGRETLRQLEAEHGPLPKTPTVGTPSGGLHLCFRWTPELDEVLVNDAKILPGLDVRCTGGYVIAPWSFNAEEGRPYALLSDPSTPLADAPLWLIGLLRKRRFPDGRGIGNRPRPAVSGPLPGSDDWDPLARFDYMEALATTRSENVNGHRRNKTLHNCAFWIFRKIRLGKIPEGAKDEIWRSFMDAGQETGLTAKECERTLDSAWKGVWKKPLTVAEVRAMEKRRKWLERMQCRRAGGTYESGSPEWTDVPLEAYGDDASAEPPSAGDLPPDRAPSDAPMDPSHRPQAMEGISGLNPTVPVVAVLTAEDARAFRADGVQAVAVGDPCNATALVARAEKARRTAPIVYHEDGSPLCKALSAAFFNNPAVPSCRGRLYPEGTDPCEVRERGEGLLREAVREVTAPWRKEAFEAYFSEFSAGADLDGFVRGIVEGNGEAPISTGMRSVDRLLDDGLFPGLYVLGAIPSNGKTTLALQISDNIAMQGRDVLFFSYEMKKDSLRARSISRGTFLLLRKGKDDWGRETDGEALTALLEAWPDFPEEDRDAIRRMAREGKPTAYATTEMGILRGDLYRDYSDDRKILISASVNLYKLFADHVFIVRCGPSYGLEAIRGQIDRHIRTTGNVPVVVVDYVQRVAPSDPRATDKQRLDGTMEGLQAMAGEFGAVVIGISSFNRDSYRKAVAMEAFKESGGIDFSADVMLGLQLEGTGKNDFDVDQAKRKCPRKIGLHLIKSRRGPMEDPVRLDYYAPFNCFVEGEC